MLHSLSRREAVLDAPPAGERGPRQDCPRLAGTFFANFSDSTMSRWFSDAHGRAKTGIRRQGVAMQSIFIFLIALLLSACTSATGRGIDEHVDFRPSLKSTVYRDQWVHRSPPEVHVQPAHEAGGGHTALFIPFRVTQPSSDPNIMGYTIARVVWQTWLSMQLFPAMEFSGDPTPYRRDMAVALARQRGADLVVGGFVTHLYAGGTAGESQLSLQIEIHDARSGQLIWSFAQAGLMPASQTRDYFLFATKTRMPSDPIQAIARAIASDTGSVIQDWMAAPPPATRMEQLDRDTRDTLFPRPDPVPAPRTGQEQLKDDRAF